MKNTAETGRRPPFLRRRYRHPVNIRHFDRRSVGERVADSVAARVGSWPFIIVQTILLVAWILFNGYFAVRVLQEKPFDPYPFILLNLALSFQAAYTGPILLISQNRQSAKDRDMAEHDYLVNQRALQHLVWQNDQIIQLLDGVHRRPTSTPPPATPPDGGGGGASPPG
ncbi:MAG: DUF1003 domain-containing protein [Actinomycetota bacterium]|nr:DUF1003 domain-containing protein [Actinomycetota bacterium]